MFEIKVNKVRNKSCDCVSGGEGLWSGVNNCPLIEIRALWDNILLTTVRT